MARPICRAGAAALPIVLSHSNFQSAGGTIWLRIDADHAKPK
jgi:hypothetical protein